MPFQLYTPVISRIFYFLLSISTLGTSSLNKCASNTPQGQYVQDLDCSDFFSATNFFVLKAFKAICEFTDLYF